MSILFGAFGGSPAPITASSNWGTTTSASPATAPNRTLTVPATNPGNLRFDITSAPVGTLTYRKNSGSYTGFSDEAVVNFANTDTLNFRLTGASDTASITIYDNTTGTIVGTCLLNTS